MRQSPGRKGNFFLLFLFAFFPQFLLIFLYSKAGLYTLMEDSLTWTGTNTTYPVYRQQQGDEVNFLYYFSVPGSWSGWLIGPRQGGSRGGLISETGARCPGEAAHAQWSYYSPDRGFTRGDIRVTCTGRSAEDNTR